MNLKTNGEVAPLAPAQASNQNLYISTSGKGRRGEKVEIISISK